MGIVDMDTQRLRSEVSRIYSRVVAKPDGQFHFHRGPAYAAELLRYDSAELAALPAEVKAPFAGIGNPQRIGSIRAGETALDIGCGAGMDLLLAARRAGPAGKAIGVDMTDAMVRRAQSSAQTASLANVEVHKGDATRLPVESASVDVVTTNGVINLIPEKERAFQEILRVLKPGGRFHLADILLDVGLSEDARQNIDLWTGWIAGALLEAEVVGVLDQLGFEETRILERFDCFRGTTKEPTARKFGVHGANTFARKPQ